MYSGELVRLVVQHIPLVAMPPRATSCASVPTKGPDHGMVSSCDRLMHSSVQSRMAGQATPLAETPPCLCWQKTPVDFDAPACCDVICDHARMLSVTMHGGRKYHYTHNKQIIAEGVLQNES